MIISEPLLGFAAQRGVLREALHQLTYGGSRPAILAVERGGVIRAGAEPLARLNPTTGEIVSGGRTHGVLADGYLFEVNQGVRGEAVAQLRGLISSRNAPISRRMGGEYSIHRNIVVEVVRVENGNYLIRLPNGGLEWVGPDVAALLLIGAAGGSDGCPPDEGVLVRSDGESIPFQSCQQEDNVFVLGTKNGMHLVDTLEVREILPGALEIEADRTAIMLTDGSRIYGLAERSQDSYLIYDEGGGLVIADARAVQRIGQAEF